MVARCRVWKAKWLSSDSLKVKVICLMFTLTRKLLSLGTKLSFWYFLLKQVIHNLNKLSQIYLSVILMHDLLI